jgi:hypothetical protein
MFFPLFGGEVARQVKNFFCPCVMRAGPPERSGRVAHSRYAARSSVSWR